MLPPCRRRNTVARALSACPPRRVLKQNGRFLVGEAFVDPDFVRFSRLRRMAEAAGFDFDERRGPPAIYLARFRAL
jgi:hypothetical protein